MASQVPGDQNELSVKAQMVAMAKNSAEYMDELCEKYTIGNCNLFPTSHIYQWLIGKKLHYWDLTLTRLQIWANALAIKKDGITVFSPPNSNFFDVKQALKPSCTAHVGANEAEGDTSLPSAPVLVPLPPAYAP